MIQKPPFRPSLVPHRGFDTSLECLVPEACGVLTSGTAYLGLADLDEIDKVNMERFWQLRKQYDPAGLQPYGGERGGRGEAGGRSACPT